MIVWHRRLNHKDIKALVAAYRLRKLNINVERSMLNKVFKRHRCSACGRGRPRRRVYQRHRDLDDDYPGLPKPSERGHMIVSDSHEYTSEPDLLGNTIRFNFTDVASGDVWVILPRLIRAGSDSIPIQQRDICPRRLKIY